MTRDQWDLDALETDMQSLLLAPVGVQSMAEGNWDSLFQHCLQAGRDAYARREEIFGPEQMREIERRIQIMVIDEKWRDHLYEIDQLRGGIGLRAYGQRDPHARGARRGRTGGALHRPGRHHRPRIAPAYGAPGGPRTTCGNQRL